MPLKPPMPLNSFVTFIQADSCSLPFFIAETECLCPTGISPPPPPPKVYRHPAIGTSPVCGRQWECVGRAERCVVRPSGAGASRHAG
jgi:hypothetical protein